MASSKQRILPGRRVRKPSDCLVPCLVSKLVINSTRGEGVASGPSKQDQKLNLLIDEKHGELREQCFEGSA